MAGLYEVFDNEQVQLITRRQAAVTFLLVAAAVGEALVLMVLVREGILPLWAGAIAVSVGWAIAAYRIVRHIRETNHVVWCVKISAAQIAGYDYARRQTALYWTDVRQVELWAHRMRIRGTDERQLDIPHLFPDFATLSHRIVELAEFHHIPILIDGRPVEDLDLYALYPFLSSAESAPGGG